MKTKLYFVIILSFFGFTAKAQSFNSQLANMLQDTLNSYVSMFSNIKGMSASVYIPGQGVWTGVSGVSYSGNPITPDMRFGVGSNTKLFVSTILLILAEDSILSLDDSLSDWLPNYPNINPNITIRQLLNHSSGISDPFFVSPWMDTINANPTRVFTPTEVLGWVGAPLFPAGTSFGYSNTNYILAGMIAKNATGSSISQLIRDSILTPLNMDSTFYDVEEPAIGTIAHRWWNNIDYNSTSLTGFNSALGCAGSIFSTSAEMVQWYNALFNGQIINQSSLNQISNFISTGSPNQGYGLGLFRNVTLGFPYWSHGGDTWGYKSQMIYDSCLHVSVCGLSNSFPSASSVQFLLYRVIKNHIPGCSSPMTGLTTVCEGTNSISYSVPPIPNATSYSWTLPSGATGISNTNSITVDFGMGAVSGDIIVRGVNDYGPGGSSTLWVTVNPIPPTPVISLNGNVLTSSALAGNQWYNSSGIINGATNTTYTISSSDSYYSIVTLQGCNSDTSNLLNAEISGLSIPEIINNISIYPNPFSFSTTLQSDNLFQNVNLTVYNTYGQIVKQINNLSGKTIVFQRDNLTRGLYLLQLTQDNKVITTDKLVIID